MLLMKKLHKATTGAVGKVVEWDHQIIFYITFKLDIHDDVLIVMVT